MAWKYGLDMGGVGYRVTTDSEDAQSQFNAGLAQLFGYNHEEARDLFSLASESDPRCAMAHWGISACLFGNYNNAEGLDEAGAQKSAQKALELVKASGTCTDVERALIGATAERCTNPDPENEKEVMAARRIFVNSLRKAHDQWPGDVLLAGVFAESILMLAPWKLWTNRDEGPIKPSIPETLEMVAVLETALEKEPDHPLLAHLYIHALELSNEPGRALATANRLRTRCPDQGHLVHMPSHIDMWVGQYKEAVEANELAVAADDRYFAMRRAQGQPELMFYVFYRLHNVQFAAWAAMFDGQLDVAMKYARMTESICTDEAVQFMLGGSVPLGAVYFEAFTLVKWHVWVRFGEWQAILDEPLPGAALFPGQLAHAHYAKGIALGVLGRVEEAEVEQRKFVEAAANPALKDRMMVNNPVSAVLGVAEAMLAGELEYRKGNYDAAFTQLREAVKRDQALIYDEPWGWMVPTRHALGALLAEQKHFAEAQVVFSRDLEQYPENLWALRGLLACAEGGHPGLDVDELKKRLDTAQQRCQKKYSRACHCAKQ